MCSFIAKDFKPRKKSFGDQMSILTVLGEALWSTATQATCLAPPGPKTPQSFQWSS